MEVERVAARGGVAACSLRMLPARDVLRVELEIQSHLFLVRKGEGHRRVDTKGDGEMDGMKGWFAGCDALHK